MAFFAVCFTSTVCLPPATVSVGAWAFCHSEGSAAMPAAGFRPPGAMPLGTFDTSCAAALCASFCACICAASAEAAVLRFWIDCCTRCCRSALPGEKLTLLPLLAPADGADGGVAPGCFVANHAGLKAGGVVAAWATPPPNSAMAMNWHMAFRRNVGRGLGGAGRRESAAVRVRTIMRNHQSSLPLHH